MNGIKTYTQTDLRVPPTQPTHLVRMEDLLEAVSGRTAIAADVVLTDLFDAVYSTSGLTLTQNTPEELVIDGVTVEIGTRILVTGQLDKTQNGIYEVQIPGVDDTTPAVLVRVSDFNTSVSLIQGLIVPVTGGGSNAGTRWKLTVGTVPAVLDVTPLEFILEVADYSKVAEKTFLIEGDTSTTGYVFAHNWDTLNISHEIFENSTGETVVAAFKRLNSNEIRVDFGVPLGVGNDLTLVIRAEVNPA